MATSVSAWKKPAAIAAGTWALDSEEHEEELIQQHHQHQHREELIQSQPLSDFPSLSTAVVTKTKKKKPQTFSLAEFNTGKSVTHGSSNKGVAPVKGLTPDELSRLPTGPRERSTEELEQRGRLGGGFKSYGSDRVGGGGGSRYGSSNEDDSSRWVRDRGERGDDTRRNGGGGFSREREPLPPSKADEVDDWGAMKKSVGATSFDRRDSRGSERGERGGGGFFSDSRSRADDADNWLAKKSFTPSSVEPRRERRGGFESGYQRDMPFGGGADADSWGKKRGEEVSENVGRPRLVLQPRSVPISNGEQQQRPTSGSGSRPGSASGPKSNPFGAARPREEVLGERGEDWKKIDEHLEEMKIKEIKEEPSFGKKSFGSGNGRMSSPEDRTGRSWRRSSSVESPAPSVENVEHAENPEKDDDSVVSGKLKGETK